MRRSERAPAHMEITAGGKQRAENYPGYAGRGRRQRVALPEMKGTRDGERRRERKERDWAAGAALSWRLGISFRDGLAGA